MAEGNPKGMGPDEPLDTLADHGIGLTLARLESNSSPDHAYFFQTAFQVWARHTEPAKLDDWKTHVDRGVVFHLSLTAWGLREGLLCKTTQAKSLGVQNQHGEWYGLASGVHTGQDHSHKMSRLHRVGRVLLETQAPSTNAQWISAMEHVAARAQQIIIRTTDYHF